MADNTNSTLSFSLDDYFQSLPIGSVERAIGNDIYGINHLQIPNAVPSNKELYGYTFFTRPQLNLQDDNLANFRKFYSLLTNSPTSIQRFIRCTLDPRLMSGYQYGETSVNSITCPLINNNNPFIPILTNNLNTISGWPDITIPTFTSKPGLKNEVYSQVDGAAINYESFDIDASFRNTRGNPILYLFYVWCIYQSVVFEGTLVPYLDFITENELDYCTRIYRLVMDKNKKIVTKIAACGAAFPIALPTGSMFDYNRDNPYNDQNKDISIRFKCSGAEYFDDILIKEFNDTVKIFHPYMRDNMIDSNMVKLNHYTSTMLTFNHRSIPRINPNNHELEWYVTKQDYLNRSRIFLESAIDEDTAKQDEIFTGD